MDLGTRKCQRCGGDYLLAINGGYKYCDDCKALAKQEADRKRYHMVFDEEDRSEEYEWEWACGLCGIKHHQKGDALNCCIDPFAGHTEPFHVKGGFYIWEGEECRTSSTLSPSSLESLAKIFRVHAAAPLKSISGYSTLSRV